MPTHDSDNKNLKEENSKLSISPIVRTPIQFIKKNEAQVTNLEEKMTAKRRCFMKLGLSKKQKLRNSLHLDFLKTQFNGN